MAQISTKIPFNLIIFSLYLKKKGLIQIIKSNDPKALKDLVVAKKKLVA